MFRREKCVISVGIVSLIAYILCFISITLAQDETGDAKIIERYKQMLNRKPKEGNTFDRLYQFYLEGNGLDAMVTDYQAEAEANPDNPNVQLILGHIYKRLGKDAEAVKAYQRAVELAPNNYYSHFALGQAYMILLQHENAINALNRAAKIAEETQTATPEDLTAAYKALGRAYFRRDRVDEAISQHGQKSPNSTQRISLHALSSQTCFVNRNSMNKPLHNTKQLFSSKPRIRIVCV